MGPRFGPEIVGAYVPMTHVLYAYKINQPMHMTVYVYICIYIYYTHTYVLLSFQHMSQGPLTGVHVSTRRLHPRELPVEERGAMHPHGARYSFNRGK